MKFWLFNDTQYEVYQQMFLDGSLCRERMRMANRETALTLKAEKKIEVSMTIEAVDERAHYWYGIISDCRLEFYDAHPPKLRYELEFRNGDSHLPADETGMPTLHLLMTLVMLGGFIAYARRFHQQHKFLGQSHLAVVYLGISLFAQLLSVFFEWCHLYTYEGDGKGLRWQYTWLPLDFLSEVSQGVSELILSFLLLALSFGWTLAPVAQALLAEGKAVTKEKASELLRQPHQAGSAALFMVMLVTQVALELQGRRYEDDFNQFHDHEHWPGYVLMGLRVFYCGLFIMGVRRTTSLSNALQVNHFLRRLVVFGSVWFLSFPVLVLTSSMYAPTSRHRVISIGAMALQTLALGSLVNLFTSKDGAYFKMSTLSQVGTLFSSSSNTHLATD